ncbi:type II toxin-antitoxin system HipA family toxin [Leptospirillum ferriphilum]|uniref:type II toxin-antitoxin system HipA family toxin n=1 Tax=Leptospirillum ferriphilum TaxID=178606 RepID=UPI0006B14872|nr:HipA domain-containing protein [Leptospirillum ferriphilum]
MSEIIYVFHALPKNEDPVLAGIFQYDPPSGPGKFRYVRSYLDREGALPISPVDLPTLGSDVFRAGDRNEGVFGVFRDALPDFWGRLVYASNNSIPFSSVTNILLMRSPDPYRPGALDFSGENRIPQSGTIPNVPDMPSLVRAAQEILDGNEGGLRPEERRLLLRGTSMGGARPKATVLYDGKLFLAKFPAKDDRYDYARIEMALSDMARSVGIETPDTRLISLPDGRGVFLSERFDREPVPGKPGSFFRKGFMSALTLLGLEEMENPLGSYPAIADEARRAGIDCGPELYRRMVFNIAVRNSDDHLRNHGFIREGTGWRISPAYDLVPTPAIPGVGTFFDLSIGVGKMGRKATRENALSEAARFGLSRVEAEEIFAIVFEGVRDWRTFFSRHGVSPTDTEKFAGSFPVSVSGNPPEDAKTESSNSFRQDFNPEP